MENKKEKVCINDRAGFNMCGVINIEAFDEEYVLLAVERGGVGIEGDSLKITSLVKESGEITVIGNIRSVLFFGENEGKKKRGKGFLK